MDREFTRCTTTQPAWVRPRPCPIFRQPEPGDMGHSGLVVSVRTVPMHELAAPPLALVIFAYVVLFAEYRCEIRRQQIRHQDGPRERYLAISTHLLAEVAVHTAVWVALDADGEPCRFRVQRRYFLPNAAVRLVSVQNKATTATARFAAGMGLLACYEIAKLMVHLY